MSTATAHIPAPAFNFENCRYPKMPTNRFYSGGVKCEHLFKFERTIQLRRADEIESTIEQCTKCHYKRIRPNN